MAISEITPPTGPQSSDQEQTPAPQDAPPAQEEQAAAPAQEEPTPPAAQTTYEVVLRSESGAHILPGGQPASPLCQCPICKERRSVRNDGSILDTRDNKVVFGANTVKRDRNGDLVLIEAKDKSAPSTQPTLTTTPERKLTRKERKSAKKTGQEPQPPAPAKTVKEKKLSAAERKAKVRAEMQRTIEEENKPHLEAIAKLDPQIAKAQEKVARAEEKLAATTAYKALDAARAELAKLSAQRDEEAAKIKTLEKPKASGNGDGSRGNTIAQAGSAPTEVNRFAAMQLAWTALGEKAANATLEEAWAVLGRIDLGSEAVKTWYAKAQTQIKQGLRCQQQVVFAKELRDRQRAAKAAAASKAS